MSTKYTFEELTAAAASSSRILSDARNGGGTVDLDCRCRRVARRHGGLRALVHIGRPLRRYEIDILYFESLRRFLCPNCHATAPAFCRKKTG